MAAYDAAVAVWNELRDALDDAVPSFHAAQLVKDTVQLVTTMCKAHTNKCYDTVLMVKDTVQSVTTMCKSHTNECYSDTEVAVKDTVQLVTLQVPHAIQAPHAQPCAKHTPTNVMTPFRYRGLR